jgi:hypothetical protein
MPYLQKTQEKLFVSKQKGSQEKVCISEQGELDPIDAKRNNI